MSKKNRSFHSHAKALALLFFGMGNAAHAQQPIPAGSGFVETIPNAIKLIGSFRNEAVIESDVINERTPCQPTYPRSSIQNSETGTVKLQVLINVDGYAKRAKVIETSGFRDLDRAAMIGFLGCKFKPFLTEGVPTEKWVDMRYVWKID